MQTVTSRAAFLSIDSGPAPYEPVVRLQRRLQRLRIDGRIVDTVLLLEHEPVVTIGSAVSARDHLLTSAEQLRDRGIAVEPSDRGGDITYHGPGQLVVYPIIDLAQRDKDLHRYIRALEQAVIDALSELGLVGATAIPGLSGVWRARRKIAACGIRVARWVTMHGVSINNDLDLAPMRHDIVPCGISERGVTSMQEEGLTITRGDLEAAVVRSLERCLGLIGEYRASSLERMMADAGLTNEQGGRADSPV